MPDVYFPRDPDNPVSVAHYALIAGDVAAAERASREALRANPHSIPARINLAAALELSGNEHGALLEYLEAASRSRSNLRALVALGSAFRRRKRWTLALNAYSRAREVDPNDPDALGGLAEVLYQMDSPAAARAHIERACVVSADNAEIWNTAGRVRLALRDSLGAVAAYWHAARLKPDDWDIRRYLGYALYTSGDVAGALREMKYSVELNPRAPLSHWALGRMLSDWNRADEALFHLLEAALLDPDDPDYWFDLALAEERTGHLLASRHALNMALKLDGDYAAGHPELNDLATRLDHSFMTMERANADDVVATGPDGFGCDRCRVTPRAGKGPTITRRRVVSPPGQMQYALALCESCRQTYLELHVGMTRSGSDAHGEWRAWVPLLGREVDEVDTALALAPAAGRPALLGRLMRARRLFLVRVAGGGGELMTAAGTLDRARSRCDIWTTHRATHPDPERPLNMSTLERAIALAAQAHAGQKDKAGAPYILHPLRVMLAVQGDEARMAAVLHDVVEDSDVTLDQLREMGFPESVVVAVGALTKRADERGAVRYLEFVARAGRNDIARTVKLADIADNMDLARIAEPTAMDSARMRRYRRAKALLQRMQRTAEAGAQEALESLRAAEASGRLGTSPVVLPLRATLSPVEVVSACPGSRSIVACDFYVSGAERGTSVPGGFMLGRILNVDHHAPVTRMQRPITSTLLAHEYIQSLGALARETHASVMINHTDCDSILSSAMIMGHIAPHEFFIAASIAADHTGEMNPVADLLQGMDEARVGDRTPEQYTESVRSLILLLEGRRLPIASQRALDRRLARRDAASRLVEDGCFHLDGPLAWAITQDEIDSTFFPALVPGAALLMTAQPRAEARGRWNVKLRLGRAAPPGFTLHSLRIRDWNPGFGGRWNAGSNKRGGGTSIEPHDYANRLLAQLIGRVGS